MLSQSPSTVEHEFAERYEREHASTCLEARPLGLGQRLAQWRDEQRVRGALKAAGEPGLILDVACGAGLFWPVLAEHGNRVILAADNSPQMLDHAPIHHPREVLARVKTFHSSAFSLGLSANAVDCIFCMRLYAHMLNGEHRLALLREFHRVSRDTVIVCVRLLGGLDLGRVRDENPLQGSKNHIEKEFRQAGFDIISHQDFFPGLALSRVYVLRKAS